MLGSRMSLAQNSLPDEQGSDLREPLRSLRLPIILGTLSAPPPRPPCRAGLP